MRARLFDLLLWSGTIAVAATTMLSQATRFRGVISPAVFLVLLAIFAAIVSLLITSPLYRWLRIRPMLLPRCPRCRHRDRHYFCFPQTWPREVIRCANCELEIELCHDSRHVRRILSRFPSIRSAVAVFVWGTVATCCVMSERKGNWGCDALTSRLTSSVSVDRVMICVSTAPATARQMEIGRELFQERNSTRFSMMPFVHLRLIRGLFCLSPVTGSPIWMRSLKPFSRRPIAIGVMLRHCRNRFRCSGAFRCCLADCSSISSPAFMTQSLKVPGELWLTVMNQISSPGAPLQSRLLRRMAAMDARQRVCVASFLEIIEKNAENRRRISNVE